MNPVDSNAGHGLTSVTYPLDLVDQARGVMLDANRELFDANTADISQASAQFSELSFQITFRLDEFSTLLSDTDFFSQSFSNQTSNSEGTQDLELDQALEENFFLDPDDQEASVRSVIKEYNGLIEWLDSSQAADSPPLKADLFKEMDSEVLQELLSGTPAAQTEETDALAAGATSQPPLENSFSPKVSGASDSTVESALSKTGLTLNSDGTLDVKEDFGPQFKSNFGQAYESLAGQEGFFTKIGSALDTLTNRDNRFTLHAEDDHPQVYTSQAEARVRSAYRENVASLLNTFA